MVFSEDTGLRYIWIGFAGFGLSKEKVPGKADQVSSRVRFNPWDGALGTFLIWNRICSTGRFRGVVTVFR